MNTRTQVEAIFGSRKKCPRVRSSSFCFPPPPFSTMKLALLASTLSAAAAFAPASQQSARVATVVEAVPEYWDADYSKEPGVTAPVSFMCLQQLTIIL